MAHAMDLFSPAALEDPYHLYARLRRDSPVFELPGTGMHLVTRHRDVLEVVGRPEDFSSNLTALLYTGGSGSATLVESSPGENAAVDVLATADPPAHTAHRRMVSRTFSTGAVAALEPALYDLVAGRVDDALPAGRIEWMGTVAGPIPILVVSRLLGLPEDDVVRLQQWSEAGIELLGGVATPARMVELSREIAAFMEYLHQRVGDATISPGDDVMGDVARAVDAGDVDELEAASLAMQLVIAGSESTTSLTGTGARILAERAHLQDRLRGEPGLVPAFVEEVLRLESPFRGHFRVTTRDTELAGVELAAGTRLMLVWGAANRDPDAFDRPDEVWLERPNPKAHVGFGWGIHHCVGAPLARLEARVAIETLLARTRSFALAPNAAPPHHLASLFVRRLASLNLTLDAA
jgi:cytochrome P450 family 144